MTILLMTAGVGLSLVPSAGAEMSTCFGTYDPVLRTCRGIYGYVKHSHVTKDGGTLIAVCEGIFYYDDRRCEWSHPVYEELGLLGPEGGNGEVTTPAPPVPLPEAAGTLDRLPSADCYVAQDQTVCVIGERHRVVPVGLPPPCVPGWSAPCRETMVTLGEYYVVHDGFGTGGSPAPYIYQESNGVEGLQRGGPGSPGENPDTMVL